MSASTGEGFRPVAHEQFGPYRLDELIGRGGMGEVFRAFDTRRDRVVALKRLPPALLTEPGFRERFSRESSMVARLREPHIIPIHDYGEIAGTPYIDMRLVEGEDLAAVLKHGALSPGRAVHVLSQVADALDAAHAEGLVHRDVKPSNILLVKTAAAVAAADRRDFTYLVDFGIAKALDGTGLSQAGIVGTVAYMAPERFAQSAWDRRVDVYSLACVLYECLTGARPFPSAEMAVALHAHMFTPPPRPSEHHPELPVGFDEVIARGMAKDPADRYAGAGELIDSAQGVLSRLDKEPATLIVPDRASAAPVASLRPPPAQAPGRPSPAPLPRGIGVLQPELVPAGPPTDHAGPRAVPRAGRWAGRSLAIAALVVAVLATATVVVVSGSARSAGRVTVGDFPAAATLGGGSLYVVSDAADTVSTVDLRVPEVVGSAITVGAGPHGIQAGPDGRVVYVANGGDGTVSLIDTASRTSSGTPIVVGGRPVALAIAPRGDVLYVAAKDPASVIRVDTATATLTGTPITLGAVPVAMAVSPDGARLYLATLNPGSVATVDAATGAQVAAPILDVAQPSAIALSPDGSRLYIAGAGSGDLTVIETASGAVVTTVRVGRAPVAVAVRADGRRVYVANRDDDTVTEIDAVINTAVRDIEVADGPVDVEPSPDGSTLAVVCQGADAIMLLPT